MNPIFQYAIVRTYLEHRPKCPHCGLRNPIKKDSKTAIICKGCGFKYNPPNHPSNKFNK